VRNAITRDRYDALLLDLDGVITDTANLHAASEDTEIRRVLPEAGDGERRSITSL
jgi:beta-phosphoglucomutase-like phosphatase (HAD superfamily)